MTHGWSMGFSLVELLVVVLIIGILSAIALPQYEKIIEKSRATQALIFLRNIADAQKVYFMENGTYARKFSDLGIDIPWTGTEEGVVYPRITDTRSNQQWSVQIQWDTDADSLTYIIRLNGKYKGGGFAIYNGRAGKPESNTICLERRSYGVIFQGQPGDYCIKIMNSTALPAYSTFYRYQLP